MGRPGGGGVGLLARRRGGGDGGIGVILPKGRCDRDNESCATHNETRAAVLRGGDSPLFRCRVEATLNVAPKRTLV